MCRALLLTCLSVLSIRAADFSRDIAPILLSECLTCHSAEKAKGGYRLHTYASVLQPGKSKAPSVVPGKPDDSELFKRLVTHDEDDRMPQDDDPLTTNQIALVREWITAGATLDRGETNSPLALLLPRPNHPAPPEFYPRALPIIALAFNPAGDQLAVSGYHEVTFWTLDGHLQSRLTNAPARIHAIAFPPKTNLLAIAGGKPGRSGEISIFENHTFLTNLVQHSDELLTVAFSADGTHLAVGGSDQAIHIFQIDTWEKIVTIQQHADWVTSVNFDSSGDKIVSASRDRTARIYDATTGELETTYTGHSAALNTAVFLDKERVASAGRDKSIHLWELKDGKKQNEISGAEDSITALLASDEFLFAASADHKVRQYKIADRKLVRTYDAESPIFSIAFHPASGKLAAGAYNGAIKLWNTKDGALISTFIAAPLRETKLSSNAEK
jgi:WD40 repeat protein